MATIILSTLASAIPNAFLSTVAGVGAAVLGSHLDNKLFGKDVKHEQGRMPIVDLTSSAEGQFVNKSFGLSKSSGQLIWGKPFKEVRESRTQSGGKGGGGSRSSTTTITYRYYANFAIAIAEGPISSLKQVKVDQQLLDLTRLNYRFYNGDEYQEPDGLIESYENISSCPAYRGISYIVFEDFPVSVYGGRIPNFSFIYEAYGNSSLSPDSSLELSVGDTLFGFDTEAKFLAQDSGLVKMNQRGSSDKTDSIQLLDKLSIEMPNLSHLIIQVPWYSDSLVLGSASLDSMSLRPALPSYVSDKAIKKLSDSNHWSVGKHRASSSCRLSKDSAFNYGGTPDSKGLSNFIDACLYRGLSVTLEPIVLHDASSSELSSLMSSSRDIGGVDFSYRPDYEFFNSNLVRFASDLDIGSYNSCMEKFFDDYFVFFSTYASLLGNLSEASVNGASVSLSFYVPYEVLFSQSYSANYPIGLSDHVAFKRAGFIRYFINLLDRFANSHIGSNSNFDVTLTLPPFMVWRYFEAKKETSHSKLERSFISDFEQLLNHSLYDTLGLLSNSEIDFQLHSSLSKRADIAELSTLSTNLLSQFRDLLLPVISRSRVSGLRLSYRTYGGFNCFVSPNRDLGDISSISLDGSLLDFARGNFNFGEICYRSNHGYSSYDIWRRELSKSGIDLFLSSKVRDNHINDVYQEARQVSSRLKSFAITSANSWGSDILVSGRGMVFSDTAKDYLVFLFTSSSGLLDNWLSLSRVSKADIFLSESFSYRVSFNNNYDIFLGDSFDLHNLMSQIFDYYNLYSIYELSFSYDTLELASIFSFSHLDISIEGYILSGPTSLSHALGPLEQLYGFSIRLLDRILVPIISPPLRYTIEQSLDLGLLSDAPRLLLSRTASNRYHSGSSTVSHDISMGGLSSMDDFKFYCKHVSSDYCKRIDVSFFDIDKDFESVSLRLGFEDSDSGRKKDLKCAVVLSSGSVSCLLSRLQQTNYYSESTASFCISDDLSDNLDGSDSLVSSGLSFDSFSDNLPNFWFNGQPILLLDDVSSPADPMIYLGCISDLESFKFKGHDYKRIEFRIYQAQSLLEFRDMSSFVSRETLGSDFSKLLSNFILSIPLLNKETVLLRHFSDSSNLLYQPEVYGYAVRFPRSLFSLPGLKLEVSENIYFNRALSGLGSYSDYFLLTSNYSSTDKSNAASLSFDLSAQQIYSWLWESNDLSSYYSPLSELINYSSYGFLHEEIFCGTGGVLYKDSSIKIFDARGFWQSYSQHEVNKGFNHAVILVQDNYGSTLSHEFISYQDVSYVSSSLTGDNYILGGIRRGLFGTEALSASSYVDYTFFDGSDLRFGDGSGFRVCLINLDDNLILSFLPTSISGKLDLYSGLPSLLDNPSHLNYQSVSLFDFDVNTCLPILGGIFYDISTSNFLVRWQLSNSVACNDFDRDDALEWQSLHYRVSTDFFGDRKVLYSSKSPPDYTNLHQEFTIFGSKLRLLLSEYISSELSSDTLGSDTLDGASLVTLVLEYYSVNALNYNSIEQRKEFHVTIQ